MGKVCQVCTENHAPPRALVTSMVYLVDLVMDAVVVVVVQHARIRKEKAAAKSRMHSSDTDDGGGASSSEEKSYVDDVLDNDMDLEMGDGAMQVQKRQSKR